MTQKTFELYTLKEGQWQLDSVFNEKQDATNEAWRIHNEGHLDGVRIDQEEYDAATNKAQVATIMKRLKGDDKKSTTRRKTNRKEYQSHARVKAWKSKQNNEKKSGSANQLGLRIIAVCFILLALVSVALFFVSRS
ncbi:MAG: hypothetical protein VW802_00365 [Rhodospirillaceae bacterium]|jgi:hypothetical protein